MWRWYVEAAFLVLLCFAVGASIAAVVLARLLPAPSDAGGTSAAAPATPTAPGGAS